MPERNHFSKDTSLGRSRWGRARLVAWLAVICGASAACGEIVPIERPDATPSTPPDATPPPDQYVPPDGLPADSAELVALGMSAVGELAPAFDPEVTEYTASFSMLAQQLRVTPTPVHPDATVTVNGVEVPAGQPSAGIPLALAAETEILIEVTAPAGNSRTYTIAADRSAGIAQYAYGKASNPGGPDSEQQSNGDQFGIIMDISGDTLVVGANREDSSSTGVNGDQDNNDASNSGAVYVFRRQGDVWQQEAYIKASNTDAGDEFGLAVAIDGDVLAVGAPGEASDATGIDGNQFSDGLNASGAVYVFRRTNGVWQQEAYIKASNTGAADNFGFAVALDGDTLAAGAPGEDSGSAANQDDDTLQNSGAVYMFRHDGTTWAQEAYLKAANRDSGDQLGFRLDLDGDTLAAAAPGEASAIGGAAPDPSDNTAASAGAVYVFRRDGTTWEQEDYVKAAVPGGPTVLDNGTTENGGDHFGIRVELQGDTLVVGAHQEDSSARQVDGDAALNDALNAGAAYVFRRAPGGDWRQEAYLKPSNTDPGDLFGQNLAISGDLLAIAANGEDSSSSGLDGTPSNNNSESAGAVYLFRRQDSTWSQEAYLKASNTQNGDNFGYNLALSADTLAIGAVLEDGGSGGINGNQNDESAVNSGAVYVFH